MNWWFILKSELYHVLFSSVALCAQGIDVGVFVTSVQQILHFHGRLGKP